MSQNRGHIGLARRFGFWLRSQVRGDEIYLALLAAVVGALAGLCAVAMNYLTQSAHRLLFALGPGERLSGAINIAPWRLLLIPCLGGLLIGASAWLLPRLASRRLVDPIEANALHGGRMSMRDSLFVAVQTMISNGFGASVGLEAAYAQIGAVIGSKLGLGFKLRRGDLRILVGCGAAGAIAAAFNAPLTGAFYGFELVIGTYTLANLAPVLLASAAAAGVYRLLQGASMSTETPIAAPIHAIDYVPLIALGMLCALLAVLVMRTVTLTEQIIRGSRVPPNLSTALGGLAVGMLGLMSPRVLSAGHGAMEQVLTGQFTLTALLILFVLKALASAISLGSGFRGGLFFASLLMGSIVGEAYAHLLTLIAHGPALPASICAVAGMAGFAAAVVGGPLTMVFLALESTGSLPLTLVVLAATVASALTVRRIFGYSFATWRFHLRGEAIKSAVDIGWLQNLTVGDMMRSAVRTAPVSIDAAELRRQLPLGAASRVVLTAEDGSYQGTVLVPELHADLHSELHALVHHRDHMLTPDMNAREAIAAFELAEADALAVVDNPHRRRVIGLLTEQHALRRYAEELEKRRREVTGE